MNKLVDLAWELKLPMLRVLQAARALEIGNTPTETELEDLRAVLSGLEDLTEHEIRALEDALASKNGDITSMLSSTLPHMTALNVHEQERYCRRIAQLVHAKLPENDLKKKITPDAVYETMLNLGIITMYRSRSTPFDVPKLPRELLQYDTDIITKIFKGHLYASVARLRVRSIDDFQQAYQLLQQKYAALKQSVGELE